MVYEFVVKTADNFFKKEFSGEIDSNSIEEAIEEVKEIYAEDFGTEVENIKVLEIHEMGRMDHIYLHRVSHYNKKNVKTSLEVRPYRDFKKAKIAYENGKTALISMLEGSEEVKHESYIKNDEYITNIYSADGNRTEIKLYKEKII